MDATNQRIALIILGLALLGSIAGATVLVLDNQTVPDYLVAVGTGSLGALAGITINRNGTPVSFNDMLRRQGIDPASFQRWSDEGFPPLNAGEAESRREPERDPYQEPGTRI